MESKRRLMLSTLNSGELLIEPVWNRNLITTEVGIFGAMLLIEPVWNRNLAFASISREIGGAFNRTSMESKRMLPCGIYKCYRLLIEPVWNRNERLRT